VVSIEFIAVWVALICIMIFNNTIHSIGYNSLFPIGEWFAVIFGLLFLGVILYDFVMAFVRKFEEKALRSTLLKRKG